MGRNRTRPDTPEIEKEREYSKFRNLAYYHIKNNTKKADEYREQLKRLADEKAANKVNYRHTAKGRAKRCQQMKRYAASPRGKKVQAAWSKRTNKTKLDYLRSFNNRFKRMKEKDPTMKAMDDCALKYLYEELMDSRTSKERKDQIAFKLLPFTSYAKPTQVDHTGEVKHTQTLITSKIDELLALKDDTEVVSEQ